MADSGSTIVTSNKEVLDIFFEVLKSAYMCVCANAGIVSAYFCCCQRCSCELSKNDYQIYTIKTMIMDEKKVCSTEKTLREIVDYLAS